MEEWQQWQHAWEKRQEDIFAKKSDNPLDLDRPSHGRDSRSVIQLIQPANNIRPTLDSLREADLSIVIPVTT